MTVSGARTRYHHGDARNALLSAAAALLDETGASALSLRQVAERAGLSRQAPYNHFPDKQALLAELVGDGFVRLEQAIADGDHPDRAAVDRLAQAGHAYIAFAAESPALFRLMFAKERVDLARYPGVQAASRAALERLRAIIAALAPADLVADLTIAAWSIVHGYAILCIEAGIEDAAQRGARAAQFARMIAASA
jgi:AcrR family transcriptional regulator